jgi:hypothetical protein
MWELFLAGMWTVVILNVPNKLLVSCEHDCWNSKEANPTGLPFSAVLLFLVQDSVQGCGIVPILFECFFFLQMSDFATQTFGVTLS